MAQKKHPLAGNQNASKGHNAHLRMRCKGRDKSAWVKQAERENLSLTAWIAGTLNKAMEEAPHDS